MSILRIELLRGVLATHPRTELPPRLLEILCFFALRKRPIPREELAALIWPDLDKAAATNVCYVTLHRLKRRFPGVEAVTQGPTGYAIGSGVSFDLTELEALAAQLRSLYVLSRDEAARLEDGYRRLTSAPTFAHLNEELAALDDRCRQLAAELGERLAVHRLRSGETESALSIAEAMLDLDPCDEAGWEIVIRSHLSRRRHSDAIRAFHQYSLVLERELALPPSDHLRHLLRDPLLEARSRALAAAS